MDIGSPITVPNHDTRSSTTVVKINARDINAEQVRTAIAAIPGVSDVSLTDAGDGTPVTLMVRSLPGVWRTLAEAQDAILPAVAPFGNGCM